MAAPMVLLVGASRGLGKAMALEFAARGWDVIATVRDPGRADFGGGGIEIEMLDINAPDQIAALRECLSGRRIDVLFVNAGVAPATPFASLHQVSDDEFAQVMVTNALGPMRVIEALEALVPADGLIGAMSSGQGSIAGNVAGRNDAYRASKAALNMLMQGFAARRKDDPRALMLLAPGWIRTELGGPDAPFTIEESAPILVDLLLEARATPGLRYVDRFGKTVPW
ncbi:SDR family NAD(P)-dependent oxidoreductase [Sphingomonas sp. AP4-R1]|uniref:SDR family NAD(P)-dependent oxidoreductase n=1 Tax=Sphingomonas sp. AP4-R1 TaxID=2735134 RepID=UPI001493B33E|nr:SDR family NAD(P)-dependent oxidoreductase [Sphingomonas sp. AP4-R1]QJU58813.1 SDR family NAD(P)-dependent oxidoreductase [Sphingomonas sp. AP4-R1]